MKERWPPLLPQGDSTLVPLASVPIWVLAAQAAGNVTTFPGCWGPQPSHNMGGGGGRYQKP